MLTNGILLQSIFLKLWCVTNLASFVFWITPQIMNNTSNHAAGWEDVNFLCDQTYDFHLGDDKTSWKIL